MLASHFWPAGSLDTGHPAMLFAALLLFNAALWAAAIIRRRVLRRRLEQHWRDITAVMRDQARPRVDVTLPLAALLALLAGSAVVGAVVGLAVMALAANRHGLSADERLLFAAAQPTTTKDTL